MKPVWTVAFAIFFLLTPPTGGGQAREDGPKIPSARQHNFIQALSLLESNDQADIDRALILLERAASEGAPLHVILGDLYSRGDKEILDYQKAAHWYRIAAEAGDGIGQLEFGKLNLVGRGMPINLVQATLYLQLAKDTIQDETLRWEAVKMLTRAKRQISLEDWREIKKRLNRWQPKPLDELLN